MQPFAFADLFEPGPPIRVLARGMKPRLLGIEAIVCGAPSVVAGATGSLIFLYTGVSMLSYQPAEGAKGIGLALGLMVAIWQYANLASRTIDGTRYEFGTFFWVGVGSGLFGIWYAINLFGPVRGSILAVPIAVASIHFIWLQLKRRK